jgi:O-antigen/teichoic acid export membrane protein
MMEAFIKSNRLALMWAVPFGAGMALFGADLVDFVLGDDWQDALILIQVFGITAVLNHVGFNWVAFYRAIGNTRPEAIVNLLSLATFLVVAVPLLFAFDLDGLAAGTAVMAVVAFLGRWYYLVKLFPALRFLRHLARAIAPTIPAVGLILLVRLAESGERTAAIAVGELVVFIAASAIATFVIERRLLAEAVSYLRPEPAPAPNPG